MRRSIFNPANRNSAQNPESGGSNSSITRQVIAAIFGRTPLFFNSGLGDVIVPTVDTTLYYPLKPIVKEERRTTVPAGALHLFQIKPPANKHWMISYMTVGIPEGSAGGLGGAQLAVETLPTNFQVLCTHDFPATLPVLFNTENISPLVGTKRAGVDNVTVVGQPYFYQYEGVKSLYLTADMTANIIVFQNAMVIPGIVQLFYTYLELPDNQPFGPLSEF